MKLQRLSSGCLPVLWNAPARLRSRLGKGGYAPARLRSRIGKGGNAPARLRSRLGKGPTLLMLNFAFAALIALQAQPPAPRTVPDSARDMQVQVGKSIILSSPVPIERVAVGFGDVVEATAVGPREVLVSGKTPGETSLIIWQQGGNKLIFDVAVRPNLTTANNRIEVIRREMEKEIPGQKVNLTVENDTVFLRGQVKTLMEADRATAIASTLGKTVNLLYVDVPAADAQILLKVRFASVDRSVSTELGLNLVSTGAANTIGSVGTQQFSPPRVTTETTNAHLTLSDALNIFLLRPDLNLAATLRALQRNLLVEILAEPNVLATNGKQASFLAGGEFPFPMLQGGGGGIGQITVQFREFGVRINFIPTITPRGTIRLKVAPEVSALDFANGLNIQGFQIPALTVRRVDTEIELQAGQSFAIGGLLDNRLTETLSKIPLLGDIPVLGKIFRSKALNRQNTELLVIITPELVHPIDAGKTLPEVNFPRPFIDSNSKSEMRTPGMDVTGLTTAPAPIASIPMETLIQSLKPGPTLNQPNSQMQQPQLPFIPVMAAPSAPPQAPPAQGTAPAAGVPK